MDIECMAMDRGKMPRQHQCPIREGGYFTECLESTEPIKIDVICHHFLSKARA